MGFQRSGDRVRADPGKIEFVCTGNICRSPFAAAAAVQRGLPAKQVSSSGVWAEEGRACPSAAVHAAARFGLDLSHHRSRRIQPEDAATCGWIGAMEYPQLRELGPILPKGYEGRLFLLGEFLPEGGVEIPDPHGMDSDFYTTVYKIIYEAVGFLVAHLRGVSGIF